MMPLQTQCTSQILNSGTPFSTAHSRKSVYSPQRRDTQYFEHFRVTQRPLDVSLESSLHGRKACKRNDMSSAAANISMVQQARVACSYHGNENA